MNEDREWWFRAIGKLHIHVKIILFVLPSILDHILIGENYMHRGGIGPLVCSLCLKIDETTQNLMVDCEVS